MCSSGEEEDIDHFLLRCQTYKTQRDKMVEAVGKVLKAETAFEGMGSEEESQLLLGGRMHSKGAGDRVDWAVKRFLKRAWRIRKNLTMAVNETMDRQDIVDMWELKSGQEYKRK